MPKMRSQNLLQISGPGSFKVMTEKVLGLWHRSRNPLLRTFSTSISDNQVYPQFCMKAALDYRVFNRFRSHPVYNEILEHVTEDQGRLYLAEICKHPEISKEIDRFRENDRLGGPRVFDYAQIGKISPSTLRYVKVLADLAGMFGSLDRFKICEIGVGYGGQCRIINSYYHPAGYTLVDLKPALMLAQRFLDNFIIPATLSYSTMNELEPTDYDLVISNYAFTELPRDVQDTYLERVILRSRCGYITYNAISPPSFRSYRKEELVEIIPGSRTVDEIPLTHPGNCIIVWGDR